jgi:hypothetical protein
VPFSTWTDENFDDYWGRILDWLDSHLAPPADA